MPVVCTVKATLIFFNEVEVQRTAIFVEVLKLVASYQVQRTAIFVE